MKPSWAKSELETRLGLIGEHWPTFQCKSHCDLKTCGF
jgi:hypothetical protein